MRRGCLAGLCAAAVLAAGCGADLDFKQARHLEDGGQHFRAVQEFRAFLKKHPDDPRATEARLRAGRIYAEFMGRCEEAVPLLEAAARDEDPAHGLWAEGARLGLLSCPDFFPLRAGSTWLYVDTASGGAFMRLQIGVHSSSANVRGLITGEMYAGKQMIRKYARTYTKEGWAVYEKMDGVKAPILKYPFIKDRSWDILREGRTETFRIVAADASVEVKAGKYEKCLKIQRRLAGEPSWVYDYYCPGVGRVKTTVGIPGTENPNTELAEYKPAG